MNNLAPVAELQQLPDQVYQARLAVLEAERRFIAADRGYDQVRFSSYLSACDEGASHFRANNQAAVSPEVASARCARDHLEAEYKMATAAHNRLLDRLKVLLALCERQGCSYAS